MEQDNNNSQQAFQRSYEDFLLYGESIMHTSVNQQGEAEIRRVDPITGNGYVSGIDPIVGEGNSFAIGNGLMNQITTYTSSDTVTIVPPVNSNPNQQYYSNLTQRDLEDTLTTLSERSRYNYDGEFNIIVGQGFRDRMIEEMQTFIINQIKRSIPKDYKGPIILKFGGTRGNETWDKKKHGKIDKYLEYNSNVIVEIVDEKTNQLIELNGTTKNP